MTDRKSLLGAGIAVALTLAAAGTARADDKSQLEQRVKELETELQQMKETLRGGYFTANSDLEARVSELERMAADNSMSTVFKNGLKSEGGDGAFKYQWFGMIQNDWNWYWDNGDDYGGELNPEMGFRRIRLGATGQMYGNIKWWSELDFASDSDNDVRLADMWMEIANCNFGSLRVGHMKEPFGFDWQTSDKYNNFMERNYIYDIGPGRNLGMMLHGRCADDKVLYQAGMFRDTDSNGFDVANSKDGEYNFTARVSGRPLVDDDGKTWLHVGAAGSYRDFSDDTYEGTGLHGASTLGGATFGFGSTGVTDDDGLLGGLEAAFVTGPITLMGEWAILNLRSNSDIHVLSVEAAYWLTGENTAYDPSYGGFGRPIPKQNYGDGEGAGAWQIAARWEMFDQQADDLDCATLGLNWWLNPNTRVSFNAMHVMPGLDEQTDNFTTLAVRFQIDF
jgi:phosphate-selective porin OprO/OprP